MKEITRSTVARLLATENITVVQDNVRTASFDVKNRVLRLPSWSDVESYTEDHLIGHEVGHALYTPLDGWHEAVCNKGAAYKSYLNVVEDARIEKLIQRKYPGLRAPFVKSYRKLLKDGFFGGQLDDINKMSLIDRINVYFKCGQSIGVKFDAEDTQWLPRIDAAETWEDVVAIVDELFAQELEKKQQRDEEQEQEQMLDDQSDAEASDWDMDGDEGDEESWGGDESEEGEDDESDYDQDVTEASDIGGMEGSQTDKTLRDNIANELMDKEYSEVYHLRVDVPKKYDEYIIPFKDIIAHTKWEINITDDQYRAERAQSVPESSGPEMVEKFGTMCYDDWTAVNKKAVNHMVKEFEMRKSAAEYARASVSKTGVIDTVKMNHYKLTDDIFKKVTILPEGKNHGFIMYLDMSGSMGQYMYETVEQTLLLAHFAKQINVPFRVYGFTSNLSRWNRWDTDAKSPFDDAASTDGYTGGVHPFGVKLLELFSDKMSRSEMTYMSKTLLANYLPGTDNKYKWSFVNKHGGSFRDVNWMYTDRLFQLGGTPLNHALVVGMPLAQEFRAGHRIDILNTILLTDGASHDLEAISCDDWGFRFGSDKKLITYTCPINNKTYKVRNFSSRNGCQTDALLAMYKDVTGSSIIGYRIESNRTRDLANTYTNLKGTRLGWDVEADLAKEYRREGWVKVENAIGYDECFILNAKSLGIEDNKMDDLDADASKAKIRGAFRKAQGNTKKTRRMLTDLMERVA
jgi:hypothetical protein